MHDQLIELRFWRNVKKTDNPDDCWYWGNRPSTLGYGYVYWNDLNGGGPYSAHRLAYELAVGPIPDKFVVDHECHNRDPLCKAGNKCPHRLCCNPAHLAAKSRGDNTQAGPQGKRNNTHCPRDHEFTEANTRWVKNRNGKARQCRTCAREKTAFRRAAEGRRDYE